VVEFRFVFDQRPGCDTIAGTDSRRSAGPAFVSDELRALKLGDPDVQQLIAYLRTLHG